MTPEKKWKKTGTGMEVLSCTVGGITCKRIRLGTENGLGAGELMAEKRNWELVKNNIFFEIKTPPYGEMCSQGIFILYIYSLVCSGH